MEEKINIAEILKDKPQGTKLYADAFGELKFVKVDEVDTIYTKNKTSTLYCFYNNGKYDKYGEHILVPSKEMRDWNKFAWKKGDVLISNDYSTEVIFYNWYDDTYTNFYGKHRLDSEDKNNIKYNDAFLCTTERYSLEDKDAAQTYINTIEERLGGKLNLETLEIEKQHEKKEVVDLNPKWTPKPFDRVITRNAYDDIWTANIFSHMNSCGEYVTIGCAGCYHYCLPYNDETAHLLGTTDEWKVGKG